MPNNQTSTLSGDAETLLQRRTAGPDFSIELSAAVPFFPDADDFEDGSGLGGNRQFVDLRGVSSKEVKNAFEFEATFLHMLADGYDYECALECLFEDERNFFGLDAGIASATLVLSALGAIPFSSCNGGLLGGVHQEAHPLIAFYAPSDAVLAHISDRCAPAKVALRAERGRPEIIAFSNSLRPFRAFTEQYLQSRERLGRA